MKTKVPNNKFIKTYFGRVAIVHDDFVAYGGGEVVLETLLEMFPEADFFTSYADKRILKKSDFNKNIKTGWIQKFSFVKKAPSLIQLFSPFIWPAMNLEEYDLVISHGGFYLSNLINLFKKKSALTVYYSICPPKNLYSAEHRAWWEKPVNFIYYPVLRFLDKRAVKNADLLLSVSKDVQQRIRKIYSRDSEVIYPPVIIPRKAPPRGIKREYYLYIGRLSREKNLSLLIDAFNINSLPLLIVGTGPEEKKLKSRAFNNITFLGYKPKGLLDEILYKAKAFIHVAGNDDFPLAPIEAMGHGVPLIIHKSGGTREAVIDGKTGIIFKSLTAESVNNAVLTAEKTKFDPRLCFEQSKRFSKERFKKEFLLAIKNAYDGL